MATDEWKIVKLVAVLGEPQGLCLLEGWLVASSSAGLSRGSGGAAIIVGVESNDAAARDDRVEPRHDVTRRNRCGMLFAGWCHSNLATLVPVSGQVLPWFPTPPSTGGRPMRSEAANPVRSPRRPQSPVAASAFSTSNARASARVSIVAANAASNAAIWSSNVPSSASPDGREMNLFMSAAQD